MNTKSLIAVLVIAGLLFVLLSCGLLSATYLGNQYISKEAKAPVEEVKAPAKEASVTEATPAAYAGGEVTLLGDCVAKATEAGDPNKGATICKDQTSSDPVARMQSGSKIVFGSITFDAESRVWVLQNFIVPASSGYAFDYEGREQRILDAPFVVGSEMSPVTGKPFEICWDTTSNGCVPPVKIEFFQ